MFLTPVMQGKRITRRTVRSRRDALDAEVRASASARIATATVGLLEPFAAGVVVALYATKGSEVDTTAIDKAARDRGLRVAYPRVVDGDRQLAFHESVIDELVVGTFGLREPRHDSSIVSLDAIAAFVIPGLAFDRHGGRVGWGHGYYDATLARAAKSALRIGLAFECQIVDGVPHDPHDAHLDVIVTERELIRVARP